MGRQNKTENIPFGFAPLGKVSYFCGRFKRVVMADAVAQRQQKQNRVPVTQLRQRSQYLSKKGGHHMVLEDKIGRCCRRWEVSLKL